MSDSTSRVFGAEKSRRLDSRFRRLVQNPRRILKPFVREGMTVLDVGCGTGYFTVPAAEMVGESGRVIAADLQEKMLEKLSGRLAGTGLEKRVELHRTGPDSIGVTAPVDFVLLYYVVHEVPDREKLFREVAGILKPGGKVLVVEPDFRVTWPDFRKTVEKAVGAGFQASRGPWILFSRSAVLGREP